MRLSSIRRLLGAAGLVLAVGVASLLACEGVARAIYPPLRGLHWYHEDPRYGMRHRRNLDKQVTEWGGGAYWHFRTNARGFRGDDWPDMPAPGERRVLVAGDSFTFGNGVSEGGTFVEIADRLIRRGDDGGQWRVLNLGTSAWGPQNALAYLESEGAEIGASCLVYAFFLGNDVMDNVASHLYSLRDGRLEKNPVAVASPHLVGRVKQAMRALPVYDFLLDHSQLFNLARVVFLRNTVDLRAFATTYAEVPRETYQRALDLDDATLGRMAQLARRRFGGFAIMLLPELAELDGTPELHQAAALLPLEFAEEARGRVKQWAEANAVPVLDLVELLPHDPGAARSLYFPRDFHPNSLGHRRIGELLAQHLPQLCGNHQPLRQSAHRQSAGERMP
jgi:lysophospholipase L1-like esterase